MTEAPRKIALFGLQFDPVSLEEAAHQIVDDAIHGKKGLVVTPNADHIVQMENDPEMRRIFREAAHTYADGMPLVWLSRFIRGKALPARVTGADLLPEICRLGAESGLRFFFLGGWEGVAEEAARNLIRLSPKLQVVGTYSPPANFDRDPAESKKIVDMVNSSKADILFVGVGAPRQEKWVDRHLNELQISVAVGVGAALDFAANRTRRSPPFLRNAGFEWLWRLLHEPRRLWRRYLVRDLGFFRIAAREFLFGNRN